MDDNCSTTITYFKKAASSCKSKLSDSSGKCNGTCLFLSCPAEIISEIWGYLPIDSQVGLFSALGVSILSQLPFFNIFLDSKLTSSSNSSVTDVNKIEQEVEDFRCGSQLGWVIKSERRALNRIKTFPLYVILHPTFLPFNFSRAIGDTNLSLSEEDIISPSESFTLKLQHIALLGGDSPAVMRRILAHFFSMEYSDSITLHESRTNVNAPELRRVRGVSPLQSGYSDIDSLYGYKLEVNTEIMWGYYFPGRKSELGRCHWHMRDIHRHTHCESDCEQMWFYGIGTFEGAGREAVNLGAAPVSNSRFKSSVPIVSKMECNSTCEDMKINFEPGTLDISQKRGHGWFVVSYGIVSRRPGGSAYAVVCSFLYKCVDPTCLIQKDCLSDLVDIDWKILTGHQGDGNIICVLHADEVSSCGNYEEAVLARYPRILCHLKRVDLPYKEPVRVELLKPVELSVELSNTLFTSLLLGNYESIKSLLNEKCFDVIGGAASALDEQKEAQNEFSDEDLNFHKKVISRPNYMEKASPTTKRVLRRCIGTDDKLKLAETVKITEVVEELMTQKGSWIHSKGVYTLKEVSTAEEWEKRRQQLESHFDRTLVSALDDIRSLSWFPINLTVQLISKLEFT